MVKRISRVILILCVLLTIAFPCFADFQPNSDRWFWCGSNDTIGAWLDKDSVYELPLPSGDTRVYIWALFYHNTPSEYIEKIQYTIALQKHVFNIKEYIREDMEGNIIGAATFDDRNASGIVPGSYSELFYKVAKLYHETHN